MRQYTGADLYIYSSSVEVIHKLYDKDPPDFSELIELYTMAIWLTEIYFERKIIGKWAVFHSEIDWLIELLQKFSIQEIFNRVLPFMRAGRNGCRPEIFLTAYADVVATGSQGEVVWIKGTEEMAPEHIKKKLLDKKSGRVVAFSLPFVISEI